VVSEQVVSSTQASVGLLRLDNSTHTSVCKSTLRCKIFFGLLIVRRIAQS